MGAVDSMVNEELGRSYRLIALLSEGGASQIYEAERLRPPRRKVVVKMMHPVLVGDEEMAAQFDHEAEVLGELQHDHVVELIDVGQTDEDLPYLVMESLEGETLRERLDRDGPLAPKDVANLVKQAASALGALHALKVVHRDVNPSNLFLVGKPDDDVKVKLIDFALALGIVDKRKKGQPEVIGSEGYMSPEQFRGEVHEVDAATDVFALAVVAYEALSGRRPFEAEDEDELLRQVCKADPTPITARVKGLHAAANQVFARAMAKDRGARFGRIEEFARDLAEVIDVATPSAPSLPVQQPVMSTELETTPDLLPAPVDEVLEVEAPLATELPEPQGDDLLGGMTLLDTPPSFMESPSPVPPEGEAEAEETPVVDASLAGQTLLGDEDFLNEIQKAGEAAPSVTSNGDDSEPSGSDRHTVMLPDGVSVVAPDEEGEEDAVDPERHTLVLPDDAPEIRAGGQPTADYTLLGEEDVLEELDGQKKQPDAQDKASYENRATNDQRDLPHLAGQEAGKHGAEKAVTVFQGDAWSKAAKMTQKRTAPATSPQSEDVVQQNGVEPIEANEHRAQRRFPMVMFAIVIVLIVCSTLYLLSR